MPLVKDPDDLAAGLKKIHDLCAARGRDPATIHTVPFGLEGQFRTRAECDALGAAGAQEILVWLLGKDLKEILDEIKMLAAELIA